MRWRVAAFSSSCVNGPSHSNLISNLRQEMQMSTSTVYLMSWRVAACSSSSASGPSHSDAIRNLRQGIATFTFVLNEVQDCRLLDRAALPKSLRTTTCLATRANGGSLHDFTFSKGLEGVLRNALQLRRRDAQPPQLRHRISATRSQWLDFDAARLSSGVADLSEVTI